MASSMTRGVPFSLAWEPPGVASSIAGRLLADSSVQPIGVRIPSSNVIPGGNPCVDHSVGVPGGNGTLVLAIIWLEGWGYGIPWLKPRTTIRDTSDSVWRAVHHIYKRTISGLASYSVLQTYNV